MVTVATDQSLFRWDWVVFWVVMSVAWALGLIGGLAGAFAATIGYCLGRWDADYGQKWRV